MKGFIINLDAVVALSFIFFAILIITSQSYHPRAPGGIYLKQLTLDTITVLEKTGRVDRAMSGNVSAISEVVEATPKLACIAVSIYDSNGLLILSSTKSDCTEKTDLDIQTTAGLIMYQQNRYVIKTEAWFRKEP